MNFKFEKRKTKKDKERRNHEYNGKYSQKHIRIQEQNQENHLKNIKEKQSQESQKRNKKSKTKETNEKTNKDKIK
jgi:hypothetical protein